MPPCPALRRAATPGGPSHARGPRPAWSRGPAACRAADSESRRTCRRLGEPPTRRAADSESRRTCGPATRAGGTRAGRPGAPGPRLWAGPGAPRSSLLGGEGGRCAGRGRRASAAAAAWGRRAEGFLGGRRGLPSEPAGSRATAAAPGIRGGAGTAAAPGIRGPAPAARGAAAGGLRLATARPMPPPFVSGINGSPQSTSGDKTGDGAADAAAARPACSGSRTGRRFLHRNGADGLLHFELRVTRPEGE